MSSNGKDVYSCNLGTGTGVWLRCLYDCIKMYIEARMMTCSHFLNCPDLLYAVQITLSLISLCRARYLTSLG